MQRRILVTGGAGYIGSHTVVALVESGHEVVVVDSFANSKPSVVGRLEKITGSSLTVHDLDVRDTPALSAILADDPVDSVIHFAGLKAVGESVDRPWEYYDTNVGGTLSLLDAMRQHDIVELVFSSSATVYGPDAPVPYREDHEPLKPVNPYGQTKAIVERILTDLALADPRWRIALLRYFNPAGAHPSGLIGEHPPDAPQNLMPYLAQVAVGRLEKVPVYGGDYPTADGTGERDYLHVLDLAEGHVAALDAIHARAPGCRAWNLGTGHPTSVLQMLRAFERAVGREIPHEIVPRRPGDLASFWADASRAESELGWQASRTVDDMCADAWAWQKQNPNGYPDD